jgi:hypothetical protein
LKYNNGVYCFERANAAKKVPPLDSAKHMTSEQYIKLGRRTALVSFIVGTSIFGLFILTFADDLLILGYGFIVLTGLINIVVLGLALIRAIIDKGERKRLLITCGFMLLNIPVVLFYCWIIITLIINDPNNYY